MEGQGVRSRVSRKLGDTASARSQLYLTPEPDFISLYDGNTFQVLHILSELERAGDIFSSFYHGAYGGGCGVCQGG